MKSDSGQDLGDAPASLPQPTAEDAKGRVDSWGPPTGWEFGIHAIARALRAEIARLETENDNWRVRCGEAENDVVFGFYEEEKPIFMQGYNGAGGCELASLVTAAEVTGYVDRIVALEVQRDTLQAAGTQAINLRREAHANYLAAVKQVHAIRRSIGRAVERYEGSTHRGLRSLVDDLRAMTGDPK